MKRRDLAEELAQAIRAETASALGRTGRQLKRAIDALAACDGAIASRRSAARREQLLRDAARVLHGYVIQKELLDIADHATLTRVHAITPEIWGAMGAMQCSADE